MLWKVMATWQDLLLKIFGNKLKLISKLPRLNYLKHGMLPFLAGRPTVQLQDFSESYTYTTKGMLRRRLSLRNWKENTVCFRVANGMTILVKPMKITRKVFSKFNVKIRRVPISLPPCSGTLKNQVTLEGKTLTPNCTVGQTGPTGPFSHDVFQIFSIMMKQVVHTLIHVLP